MRMDKKLLAARMLLDEAKNVLADYRYIYDPLHKKRPEGGMVKTDKGWSNGKKRKEKGPRSQQALSPPPLV